MQTLKERLAGDGLVRVIGMGRLAHHNYIQVLGIQGGLHGLWFDLEHGSLSIEALEIACVAARSVGLDTFCRLAPTDYASVTRCFESGSSGVMAAQIRTAAEAEEFVSWSKFAPRGQRGLNVGGRDGRFGQTPVKQFCDESNERTLVAIQIETAEALEDCERIAAIDGVDLLFVGPSDLSQNLGVTGDFFHEKCVRAIERVGAACRDSGKNWGAVTVNPEHAQLMIDNGCRMISPTSDVKLVAVGLQALRQTYAQVFSDGAE